MHQSVIKVTRWNLKVISLRILLQMSTLPYQNETKMTDVKGTHTMHGTSLVIFNAYRCH